MLTPSGATFSSLSPHYHSGSLKLRVTVEERGHRLAPSFALTSSVQSQLWPQGGVIKNNVCLTWHACNEMPPPPTLCTVHQPSVCRLRVSHAVSEQLAVLSMSLSFSKEPGAAEANGSNRKGTPRVSAEVSQVLLHIHQQKYETRWKHD